MPTNYRAISFAIDTKHVEERQWLLYVGSLLASYINCGDSDWDDCELLNDEEEKALRTLSDTDVCIEEARHTEMPDIYICGESYVDINAVGIICQLFLKRFRPNSCIFFTWAEYCDAPRIGEFGGGYCIVTANGDLKKRVMDHVYDWLNAHEGVPAANLM